MVVLASAPDEDALPPRVLPTILDGFTDGRLRIEHETRARAAALGLVDENGKVLSIGGWWLELEKCFNLHTDKLGSS